MSRANRFRPLMPAALLIVVLFGSGLAGFAERADKEHEDPKSPFAKLKSGMTPDEVRQIVGAPKHIARQILYHRYREQWIYDAPDPIRLTFDCPRGELPQLLSIKGLSDKVEPRP